MFKALATMQAEALKSSKWVGDSFADDARAMHYGEKDVEAIHGQATPEEARDLIEEGIEIAPVLFRLRRPAKPTDVPQRALAQTDRHVAIKRDCQRARGP
jgi:hypothetical protein